MNMVDVECSLYELEKQQYDGKPFEPDVKEELRDRLTELTWGRTVPVVVFNCLDFTWRPSVKGRYPKAVVSSDPKTSICRFFQDEIVITLLELEKLGRVDLKIVIPDSELLDERVFSLAQSREERMAIALNSRIGLADELFSTIDPFGSVVRWSEYCYSQTTRTPLEFTAENYQRIQDSPKLQRKVTDQAKDSRKYFERNGIDISDVKEEEFIDRTAWYLAMYMGEGQVLSKTRAICLNLEDNRVPAWFQRGATMGAIPILTPVNSKEFYTWRAGINGEQKL